MRDDTSLGVSTFAESLTGEAEKRDRAQLKQRLARFWNSQDIDRDLDLDETAPNLPLRKGSLPSFPNALGFLISLVVRPPTLAGFLPSESISVWTFHWVPCGSRAD